MKIQLAIATTALALAAFGAALAQPQCPPAPPPAPPAPLSLGYRVSTDPIEVPGSAVDVYDADTFDLGDERFRINNLDAPEVGSRADCDSERALGDAATAAARQMFASAQTVVLYPERRRDRYSRVLVRVDVDGRDLAVALIEQGLGRPWRGRSSDWCATAAGPSD